MIKNDLCLHVFTATLLGLLIPHTVLAEPASVPSVVSKSDDAALKGANDYSANGLAQKFASFLDSDAPLTWKGVTFYGTLDAALSNQTHASGYNAASTQTVGEVLQKGGTNSQWNIAANAMEQNKVGLKGKETIFQDTGFGDLDLVFKVETGFNPVSGVLSNGQQSQIDNNGITSIGNTTTSTDSSRAGQVFQGAAYGGLSNKTFGTLTFGRQTTVLADNVTGYDPQGSAYAFSPIEWSGTVQGGGATEDARYDDSMKYSVAYGPARFSSIYQFGHNTNSYGGDDAFQGDVGYDIAGLSVDGLYGFKHDAIVTAINPTATQAAGNLDQLKATTSDNTTYAVFAKYDFKNAGIKALEPMKLFFGYERDLLTNAHTPVALSNSSLGGFHYSSISNTAYNFHEKLDVFWGGVRYVVMPKLTLSAADYVLRQNNFSGIDDNGACIRAGKTSCEGTQNYSSLVADYQLTKKIDAYVGVMYSHVYDGSAVGYLHNNNVSTTSGMRLKF